MNFRVLDLSAHQGDIDFSRVKKDGIWGVMLKATEGQSYLSPAFDKNYEQAIKAGLHVGAYHYLRAANALDSLKEAQFFLQSVKGKPADSAAGSGYRSTGAKTDPRPCTHRQDLLSGAGTTEILCGTLQHGFLVSNQAFQQGAKCLRPMDCSCGSVRTQIR